jgi:hypothetical protein
MSRMSVVVVSLLALALSACANPAGYFSLQEFGQGWKLKVEEKGETFRASWVKGDHTSAKLANYQDTNASGFIVVNTLYLEIEKGGKVANGRLKRVVTPEFSKQAYYERNAQWFRVISGTCVLDAEGNGVLDVLCEGGYAFKGEVVPDEKMEIIKPE